MEVKYLLLKLFVSPIYCRSFNMWTMSLDLSEEVSGILVNNTMLQEVVPYEKC